jgi:opacity protein-like surface antigen
MSSYRRGRILAVAFAALAMAATASAQSTERGYVVGLGGAAITEVNSATYGGGVGINLTRNLQITGEVVRMQDILASFTRDDLRLLEQMILEEGGVSSSVTTKTRATYAMGGVRFVMPGNAPVTPYVTGTAGVAHLAPTLNKVLIEGIDFTSMVMQEPGVSDALRHDTRPVVGVGGGLTATVYRHFRVDVGYQYSRIFIAKDYLQAEADLSTHQHTGINVHRVQVGVGYAF